MPKKSLKGKSNNKQKISYSPFSLTILDNLSKIAFR